MSKREQQPLVIEHNIPIPEEKSSGITETIRQMEIGDSVVVNYSQAQGIASIAQRLGMRTTKRKIKSGWYRIWRIE